MSKRTALFQFALLTGLCFGLAGCAGTAQPYSFLDGARWSVGELNTYDTTIVQVDGTSYVNNSRIKVDPGVHHIMFETRPAQGFFESPLKELVVDIKPCTRYWFEAKRVNRVTQDFEPRINYSEHIAGCGGPKEASAAPSSY